MRRAARVVLALTTVIATTAAACQPPPDTRTQPVPGRVALVGDSILIQAFGFGGDLRGADVDGKTGFGWGPGDVLARVRQDAADPTTSPAVLVVAATAALGESYGDQERAELVQLVLAPHSTACVVLLVPNEPATRPEWWANLDQVTADLEYLAEVRPGTVTVDWGSVVAEHPEYLSADGIHLDAWTTNAPAPASIAYLELIWSGVERCAGQGGRA